MSLVPAFEIGVWNAWIFELWPWEKRSCWLFSGALVTSIKAFDRGFLGLI